jgi:hypothetical protein
MFPITVLYIMVQVWLYFNHTSSYYIWFSINYFVFY